MDDEEVEFNDMSERTLDAHNGSVFCVAVTKSEKYVLTGGEDDLAYIWDISGESNIKQTILLFIFY